jgi:hypothetical protein
MVATVAGCGSTPEPPAPVSAPTPSASATPAPSATPASCPPPWSCEQQQRFAAATAFIAQHTGHIGIVVRDRTTNAVWKTGEPDFKIWAGSTPKLALAVALREQNRAGELTLDDQANGQIGAMLSTSDNRAADDLWTRYVKSSATMMTRFRDRYGMKTATYVTGFPSRWGFVKCTPQVLVNLMSYVLEKTNAADREYFVKAMREVATVQRWGVWGVGPTLQPGVKNGWSIEKDDGKDHWITATVGFAGPRERYVIAAMYHQPPGGDSIGKGVHVLTDLVATAFGAPVPAPVARIPEDY